MTQQETTKHLYEVEVRDSEGHHTLVEITANSRNQAAGIARAAGHEVWAVNTAG